ATGTLTADDPDLDATGFVASFQISSYGSFVLETDGDWTYSLNNASGSVQALNTGQQVTDTFTIFSADGTAHDVVIAVNGTDEPPPPPVVDLDFGNPGIDYADTYTENDDYTAIGNGVTITSYNGMINGAVVQLVSGTVGDLLVITGGLPPGVTIASQSDTQIQFTGMASATDYAFLLSTIGYTNTTDYPTAFIEDRTVEVWVFDNQASSQHAFAAIDVIAVNDAPSMTGTLTGNATENNPTNATGTINVTDADLNESRVQAQSPTSGSDGRFQIAESGEWFYAPNDNNFLRGGEQVTDTFRVYAYDGTDYRDVVITITGLNDGPMTFVLDPLTASMTEDSGSYSAGPNGISISDPDHDESGFQAGVFNTTYGSFTITNSGNVNAPGISYWSYTLNNASAAVQGLGDGESALDSFNMTTIDGSVFFTLQITINGRSDAPVGIDGNIDAPFDGVYTFTVADFAFTDAENDGLLEVLIAGLPSGGTIRLNGVPLTVTPQVVSVADIVAGNLTFEPDSGATAGDNYASFTFVVRDDGSTANGGSNEDSTSNIITIDLFDNQPPVVDNEIPDQNIDEDNPFSFQFAADAFSDPDMDSLTYTATLANGDPLPGTLAFDGNTRTFSGSPPLDYNGTLVIRVTASDGQASVYDDFNLVVDPVNDGPSLDFNDSVTFVEDNPGNPGLSPIHLDLGADSGVSDVDSANFDGGTLTLTITSGGVPAQDILTVQADAHVTVSGSDILVDTVIIGSFTGGTGGTPYVVTFNANATPTAVTFLLRALVYDNNSQEPTSGD
ncbi:MAG TPA: VCBS domain-containing protein, partial [Actinomycetota bacterium]|nr:VCBS domain-containing protein [Actinomycetota bacterium]